MISSGGLTHRLDRLEKAGLIRREKSPRDGRSVEVALTELGAARAEQAFRTDMANESVFLQGLDTKERKALGALLRKLIALKPDHAHAYNALGYSLADRGERLEEAESLITRALELTPGDPFILDSMGWVRFRRGNPEEALRHLERAYGLRPDPEIAAHLGEVLWAMKREAEATRIWNEALRAHPDNSVLKSVMQRFDSR